MTDEQRKLVTDSLWVVNTALKEQGVGKDKDLKQDALLWLCQCAQRFDASRGVKWTTYAYSSVFLRIKRLRDISEHKAEMRKRYEHRVCATIEDDEKSDGNYDAHIEYRRIYEKCDEREKIVLDLRYAGYTWEETAKRLGLSYKQVHSVWDKIREKAKEVL